MRKRKSVESSAVVMFMGPPGSGKGAEALALHDRSGWARIETGAMLRAIRDEPSPVGRRVKALIDAGQLAPPPVVADLVLREIRRRLRSGTGVVLDGSPRTLYEAERIIAALHEDRVERVLVIMLEVPKSETVQRVLRRWVCVDCTRLAPVEPTTAEACAACGGTFVRRTDDTAEVMEKRWEEYTFRTLPVIHFLERRGMVVRVDGHRPLPAVTAEVQAVVRTRLSA